MQKFQGRSNLRVRTQSHFSMCFAMDLKCQPTLQHQTSESCSKMLLLTLRALQSVRGITSHQCFLAFFGVKSLNKISTTWKMKCSVSPNSLGQELVKKIITKISFRFRAKLKSKEGITKHKLNKLISFRNKKTPSNRAPRLQKAGCKDTLRPQKSCCS